MDNLREQLSNAMRSIDSGHAATHDGRHFYATAVKLALAVSTTKTYLLATDGNSHHFNWEVSSDGGVKVDIYEDVTATNNGTAIAVFNRDRRSTNESALTIFEDPTVTVNGTLIFSTGSTNKSGSLQLSSTELILKHNAKYRFVLTAFTNNVNVATLFDWYELGY